MKPFLINRGDFVVTNDSDGTEEAKLVTGVDAVGSLVFSESAMMHDPSGYRLATAREKAVARDKHHKAIDKKRGQIGLDPVVWE